MSLQFKVQIEFTILDVTNTKWSFFLIVKLNSKTVKISVVFTNITPMCKVYNLYIILGNLILNAKNITD